MARYDLNVDFDNSITEFLYDGTGSYSFTVPASPNFGGTRYLVYLPAVVYLKNAAKLPAISGYTRVEGRIPATGEFRTIAASNWDALLLKDAIEFPASAAGASLTMTNYYTVGSTLRTTNVVNTDEAQTIAGQKTFSSGLIITPTSDQLVLGSTRTVTVTAPTPASSSRAHTIPDVGADANFVMTEGSQTLKNKTLSYSDNNIVSACVYPNVGDTALTLPIGSIIVVQNNAPATVYMNGEVVPYNHAIAPDTNWYRYETAANVYPMTGTWRSCGSFSISGTEYIICRRVS